MQKQEGKNELKQTLCILTTETRGVLLFFDTSYCKIGSFCSKIKKKKNTKQCKKSKPSKEKEEKNTSIKGCVSYQDLLHIFNFHHEQASGLRWCIVQWNTANGVVVGLFWIE